MVAAYRDSIKVVASGSTITVTPATDDGGLTYSSGDVLVLSVYGYTSIGAPSGSDLTWTERLSDTQSGPFGNTDIVKVYTAVADASITSFTLAHGVSDQYGYCLISVSGADTSSPVDGTPAITSNTFNVTNNPTSPSISPAGSDSLLICGCGVWLGSDKASSMAPPSGMTEREDWGDWDHYSVATLGLSASGATGTKAFTESPATSASTEAWIAFSIAIKTASGGSTVTGTINSAFGGVTATAVGVPTVKGTVSQNFGALTATAAGTPTVKGTVSQTFGAMSATASGVPTVLGTVGQSFGALAATASGSASKGGSAIAAFDALTGTASATVTSPGTVATNLGSLAATAEGSGGTGAAPTADPAGAGNWRRPHIQLDRTGRLNLSLTLVGWGEADAVASGATDLAARIDASPGHLDDVCGAVPLRCDTATDGGHFAMAARPFLMRSDSGGGVRWESDDDELRLIGVPV